jgi:4-aminobutyrate aminotransferase / (S)-3-amino-2-methylpropionate transaminase / 5-aminovalerate transaminase
MEREDLPARARKMGETIREHFTALQPQYPCIGEVRGLGAMCAIEIVDPGTGKPGKELTAQIIRSSFAKGVVLLSAGLHSNVIRFLAPLVTTDEQLQEGLDIIAEAIAELHPQPVSH